MLKFMFTLLVTSFLLMTGSIVAQVGIGTITPDSSAVLDLFSTDKGFLLTRLTTSQRDAINNPANGLMIYNNTSYEVQINNGSPETPNWATINGTTNSTILSITEAGDFSTSSTTYELIPGMEMTPPAGNYLVMFNAQFGLQASVPISTTQAVIDLTALYDALMAMPSTDTHAAVFGNSETLLPGVYNVAAASSLAGILTLDGNNDTTSLFIIRTGGAFNTGAASSVVLTNGARARNVYWISEGALSLGAGTVMKGTLIANNAAISGEASSDLEGRMFSTTGAVSFGPGTAYIPQGNSVMEFGVLETFVMFTSAGAVANTEPSNITGDVGTNLGAISGFGNLDGNIYGPGAAPNPVNNTLVTFSIYVNGELLPYSSRTTDINTSVISLQAFATISEGQTIDIRWHVDTGGVVIGNRIFTLVKAN